MKLFHLFSFLVFAFTSCQTRICRELDLAESLLQYKPDSSLIILQSIKSNNLKKEEQLARRALLLSIALDKNYIDVTSDSLTSIALAYYTSNGNDRHRMLSWYCQGIVLKNARDYISAIIAFEKAAFYAQTIGDDLYSGLICRNKGNIFSLTNNNPGAIESIKDAICFFDNAHAENYKAYAELSLITAYTNHKENDKADSLIHFIRHHYPDSVFMHYCDLRQAGILVDSECNPEKALSLYRTTPLLYFGLLDYAYYAIAYESCNQPDSTDYWFTNAYSFCNDQADSATIDYLRSRVEMRRGHYETAFHLVNNATTVQDSLTRILLQQSVSSAQRDYFKHETLRQGERMKMMRKRAFADGAIAFLSLVLIVLLYIIRTKEKDRLLKESLAQLALEKQITQQVNRDNAHLVGSLFREKIAHLDILCQEYFQLEDKKLKEQKYKEVKKSLAILRNDEAFFSSIEKDLNRYCNGIMDKIRAQVPRIKGENLRIISLFFAGYSYDIIQLLLNKNSKDSLKTARSRYRKEIIDAEAPDSTFFLKMLEMKRRPQADTNESGDC